MNHRKYLSALLLLSLLLAGQAARPAHASIGTILFAVPGGATTRPCTTWSTACDLQFAISAAVSGDEVWVKQGTYVPTTTADRTISFVLKNGVAIYGGFAGTETLLSQRNVASNVTILSGEIGDPGTNVDNSYHVVVGSGTDSTAVLDGFTVTAGYANGPIKGGGGDYSDLEGAGMLNYSSASPTVSNDIFSNNAATSGGGGMWNNGGNPPLTNVVFSGNTAPDGGAMYNETASPTITNATFNDNTATGSYGGGAMFNDGDAHPVLTDVTFSGNSAVSNGGAIRNQDGSSAIATNVTFSGNSGGYGGAVYNMDIFGTNTYTNVTLSGNTASTSGSAMYVDGTSYATIQDSIAWGDTSDEIANFTTATSTIDDSVIEGGCPLSGSTCSNVITTDPVLGPLQNNGGFTNTMALGGSSSAIDAGNNSTCAATDQRGVSRPQGPHCDIGATESQYFSTTLKSTAANDGWVLESGENTNAGGSMDSAATTFNLGDDAANKQYRGILSFNTSTLPDNAVIDSVKLRIKKSGVVGADPFSSLGKIAVDIKKGSFSNNPALQKSDFQAAASQSNAALILNTLVSGWYNRTLPSGSFGFVNLTGTTQFRLRFQTDDNNNHIADDLQIFSGNAAASARPQLVITYHVP